MDMLTIPLVLPVGVAKGACFGCSADWAGGTPTPGLCKRCELEIRAIIGPPKKHAAEALAVIAAASTPNALAIAAANASGDWRRAAIAKRLGALAKLDGGPGVEHGAYRGVWRGRRRRPI